MLTLAPLDWPYGPMTNTLQETLSGGKVQIIVDFLTAVFYNSLRFDLTYSTMLPPEKRRTILVLTVK